MAKIKSKTLNLSKKKKVLVVTSSVLALTAVGVGVYLLNTKSASASDSLLKKKDIGSARRGLTEDERATPISISTSTTSTTSTEPPITTVSYDETETDSTVPTSSVPTTTTASSRTRLEMSTRKALDRAYAEYMKNVRDPKPGNMIDRSGNLYECGYKKIGTFPQGVRIFTYLEEGVGENRQYYANFDETHSCGVNEYQWCGAFIAYCWADVKFEYRSRYFPGVTRMMEWAKLNPARVVNDNEIKPGDILLIAREGASKGHHIGLCYEVLGNGAFKTIEGNTYGDGQPEGICYRTRHLKDSPYRASGKHFVIKALRPLETDLA